jgi:glycosyltransferase involved in cell wall biosynthesis
MRQLPIRLQDLRVEIASAEIVHCYGLYNLLCPAAAFFARRLNKPFLIEPMGMFTPRLRSMMVKRAYNAFFTRWMFRNAGAVVATSELEAGELRREGVGKVVVRENGIDLQEFANLPPRDAARERWKVHEGEQLVVYIGRISAKKNIRELVQAFAKLSQPNTRLLIAGPVSEPAYYRLLEDAIRNTSMNDTIALAPPVYGEDLKSLLGAADLFVLPSLNENFGNAAGEAVAANVPVLITETCGVAPVIHQRAGLAIPVGIEPLIEGMRKMLDPAIRDQMTASREKVKGDLSWDKPLDTTEELYAAIMRSAKLVRAIPSTTDNQ